jgi:hypothetical protein
MTTMWFAPVADDETKRNLFKQDEHALISVVAVVDWRHTATLAYVLRQLGFSVRHP